MSGYGPPPAMSGYGPPSQAGGSLTQFQSAPQNYNMGGFSQQPVQQQQFQQPMQQSFQQPGHQPFQQSGQSFQQPIPPPSMQQSNHSTYLDAPLLPSENPFATIPSPAPTFLPNYNPQLDVDALHKATKGFGTDDKALIRILATKTSDQMPVLEAAFLARFGKSLESLVKKETSGHYEDVLVALVQGPLMGDAELVHQACKGAGTNERLLTALLVGRNPSDLALLRSAYSKLYNKSMDDVVRDELSMKTRDCFSIVLQGRWQDNGVVDNNMIQNDCHQLSTSMRVGRTDEMLVCSIIFTRSPRYLQALCQAFKQMHHKALTKEIKQHFSGHMQDALLHAVNGGKKDGTGVWRDAKLIHRAMEGAGTKDKLLIAHIVRNHWCKPRWQAIIQAYQAKYRASMVHRVKGETSGQYENVLVAIIEAR